MKKIIFAIFTLVAFALTSCEQKGINILDLDASKFDNTTEYCWEYTQTNAHGVSITAFLWASEYNLILMLQAAAKISMESGIEVKTSYKKSKADNAEACMEKIVGSF